MNESTKNRTAAEIVAALKRHEIDDATITTTAAASVRWSNYGVPDVVEEFERGEVLDLQDWRPEGVMIRAEGHADVFAFWRDLERLTAEEPKNTGAATVDANETTPKYTREQLAKLTAQAFGRFYGVNVPTMDEDRKRVVDILDAIEEDLMEHISGDDIAYTNDDENLSVFLNDPLDAFNRGRFSYGFNPFHRDNKQDTFSDSAEYFAVDGYGNLCSIDSREYLACWYDPNISDYLSGNYSEPDEDALQALAEVFGGDYDNGEDEDEGRAE